MADGMSGTLPGSKREPRNGAKNMTDAVVAGDSTRGNVVCDLDGVVYLAGHPVPGAGEALSALDRAGFALVFVTNNSTSPPRAVAAKIRDLTGFPAEPSQVISSAQAAAALLHSTQAGALVVGGEGIRLALADHGVTVTEDPDEAGAVVVGLDKDITYERLRDAALAIRRGARFIATNTDATYPTPEGLWPGSGSIVAAIEVACGVAPEVAGKPHRPIRDLIRARLGPGPVWVVGDRPETDLAMAEAEGWSGVLVLSGVVTERDSLDAAFSPAVIVDSLVELPDVLNG